MATDYQRGAVLFDCGRYDLAEDFLRKAVAAEPENWRAHAVLACCLAANKQLGLALCEAAEAVRLAPDQGWALQAVARARLAANMVPQAEEAINEALQLEPGSAAYLSLKSAILHDQHRWLEALKCANEALRIAPENNWSENLRAMALLQLRRPEEALDASRRVLARNPEDACAHRNSGWALIQLRLPRRARRHFVESLRIDPGSEYSRRGIDQTRLRPKLGRLVWWTSVVLISTLISWVQLRPLLISRFGTDAPVLGPVLVVAVQIVFLAEAAYILSRRR